MRPAPIPQPALLLPLIATVLAALSVNAAPPAATAQLRFAGPSGMKVWVQRAFPTGFLRDPDVTAPGRLNLRQGQTYRLKLANIPGFPGLTLYPTLTVAGDARATDFLRHNVIGLELTREDFDEASAGRLITRTVALPGGPVL